MPTLKQHPFTLPPTAGPSAGRLERMRKAISARRAGANLKRLVFWTSLVLLFVFAILRPSTTSNRRLVPAVPGVPGGMPAWQTTAACGAAGALGTVETTQQGCALKPPRTTPATTPAIAPPAANAQCGAGLPPGLRPPVPASELGGPERSPPGGFPASASPSAARSESRAGPVLFRHLHRVLLRHDPVPSGGSTRPS